ncbi:M35 family metallo-endopeptidase [Ruegeria arenilitoris]|uniref:M35 family metallo-endopeptidase n=1 Tax=Ruegeria arenilitoris TaxID=1173585 RepID=UPI00147D3B75|nr:M35 family metallo-endopeptidase [Ruegeria arenilitoris]
MIRKLAVTLVAFFAASIACSDTTFVSCTPQQENVIEFAYSQAFSRAKDSEIRVGNTPSYVRWFGTWTQTREDLVKEKLSAIIANALISTPEFRCRTATHPACVGNRYAAVDLGTSFEVEICPRFFGQVAGGDRTGVLIHEIAHFRMGANAGVDKCYGAVGPNNCLDLATTDPDAAVNSPDNYRLFIGNR